MFVNARLARLSACLQRINSLKLHADMRVGNSGFLAGWHLTTTKWHHGHLCRNPQPRAEQLRGPHYGESHTRGASTQTLGHVFRRLLTPAAALVSWPTSVMSNFRPWKYRVRWQLQMAAVRWCNQRQMRNSLRVETKTAWHWSISPVEAGVFHINHITTYYQVFQRYSQTTNTMIRVGSPF